MTVGDPAGIGPEIILKSVLESENDFIPLLIGQKQVFQFYNDLYGLGLSFYSVSDCPQVNEAEGLAVYEILPHTKLHLSPGIPHIDGARVAMEAVRTGTELACESHISALVTAPIYKKGINQGGYNFNGHTDFLAHITGTEKYAMMLVGGGINVVLVTIHIPFTDIIANLSVNKIFETIQITHSSLKRFGIKNPRIAVCALNPHAGEQGIMGDEEQTIIQPAVELARNADITITGIFPADTIFWDAVHDKCDAVIAMYHDQGLIPVKVLAFDTGVNVTLGLPIIRTSPDHGTAFNIAGKNCASCASFKQALRVALKLIREGKND